LGAFLSYNYSLSRLGAARSAVFLNGIPVVTVIVAALVLGERVSYHHGIAALLVIVGVTIANQPRKRAAQAASPGVG
jgi:drug/metabolite transporter (DMT)-like permease